MSAEIIKRLENVAHNRHTISHDGYGARKALTVMADMSKALDEAITHIRQLTYEAAEKDLKFSNYAAVTDDEINRLADQIDKAKPLEKLAREYRPTMDKDVLHSWAADVVAALLPSLQWDGTGTLATTKTHQYQIHAYDSRTEWLVKVPLEAEIAVTIGHYKSTAEARAAAQADYESEVA